MKNRIEEIALFLLPFMKTAGDYAVEIQKRISNQPDKAQFSDPGGQALTDADLSIQNFIELTLLSRYPEITFYGEEYATSLNQKYFLGDDLEIWLDPIDGTLRYKKGQDKFSIIVTFVVKGICKACLWYMPSRKEFIFGSEWGGLLKGNESSISESSLGVPFELDSKTGKIFTYNLGNDIGSKLSDYKVIDLSRVDDKEVLEVTFASINDFSGIVASSAGVIDLMVAGHFFKWGGGVCTDIYGEEIKPVNVFDTPVYTDGIIAAASRELHTEFLNKLKN